MKDYKKPPFSKSRQANTIAKSLSSTLAPPAIATGTYAHPFQLATSAYSSSPSCDKLTVGAQQYRRPNLSESDSSSSSQISRPRSAASHLSNSSSVSLVQKNARTTPVHVPRLRSNNHLNESLGRSTSYDENNPPGGPSVLQQDAMQNADHDMEPAIFGAPSVRISSELPTASHHDPCFVSNLPTATTNPSQPRISQPSATCRAVSLPAAGVKRRLGMGRTTGGYSNKKFKPPT